MSFTGTIQTFAVKTPQRIVAVGVITTVELTRSIKFGSELTGAEPMPVAIPKYFKAGALRDSVTTRWIDDYTSLIFTTKWYAPIVEDNAEGHQFSSGAAHGWKRTQAAFPRVVDTVAKRVAK